MCTLVVDLLKGLLWLLEVILTPTAGAGPPPAIDPEDLSWPSAEVEVEGAPSPPPPPSLLKCHMKGNIPINPS